MLILMLISAAAQFDRAPAVATDDWQQQQMSILQVSGATGEVRVSAGDLDGDGAADEAILAVDCSNGDVASARYMLAPRDDAAGASGRKIGDKQKMWLPANFRMQQVRPTYDVKAMKGNERRVRGWDPEKKEEIAGQASADRWSPITLGATKGLCPALDEAAKKATKTRSNIQNN